MSVKRHILPAVAAITAAACAAAPAGAIVNGSKIDAATVPWFVSIGNCGGTLVMPSRVLTAAHCVQYKTVADLGAVAVGGDFRYPAHIALHPNWRHRNGSENFLDDVAIVELTAPVTNVAPVALATVDARDATILGRGRPFAPGTGHSEIETLDTSLREASLRSLTDAQCAKAFKGYGGATHEKYDNRMRCSIDADGKEPLYSGCAGDSGGPLWTGPAGAPVQLGVVSWGGDRCGADHLPSVFADVARYRSFILNPKPTWAPTRTGKARITGTARVGRTLTCSTPGYVPEDGAKVSFEWKQLASSRGTYTLPTPVGHAARYKVAAKLRGRRVACFASAGNDGGPVLVGVANALVRR
jgi:secreted trypsin-like serine protease